MDNQFVSQRSGEVPPACRLEYRVLICIRFYNSVTNRVDRKWIAIKDLSTFYCAVAAGKTLGDMVRECDQKCNSRRVTKRRWKQQSAVGREAWRM